MECFMRGAFEYVVVLKSFHGTVWFSSAQRLHSIASQYVAGTNFIIKFFCGLTHLDSHTARWFLILKKF